MDILDPEFIHSSTDGDSATLAGLVESFESRSEPLLVAVRRAVSTGDPDALATSAHELRAVLTSVGAGPAAAAADDLAELGRRASLTGLEDALHDLEFQVERLRERLDQLVRAAGG